MVSQKDIYITAQLLIKQHGDEAEDYASEMMQSFIEKNDVKGAGMWLSVGAAIDDLRNMKRQGKPH